jgi:hypothetical protein
MAPARLTDSRETGVFKVGRGEAFLMIPSQSTIVHRMRQLS